MLGPTAAAGGMNAWHIEAAVRLTSSGTAIDALSSTTAWRVLDRCCGREVRVTMRHDPAVA